jgi:hypothetical protein
MVYKYHRFDSMRVRKQLEAYPCTDRVHDYTSTPDQNMTGRVTHSLIRTWIGYSDHDGP